MTTLASRVAARYMQRLAAPKLAPAFVDQVGAPQGWNATKVDAHFRKALAQLLDQPEYSNAQFAGSVTAELEGDKGSVDIDAPATLTLDFTTEFSIKELLKFIELSAPPFFKQKESEVSDFWTSPRNAAMVEAYVRDVWQEMAPKLYPNPTRDLVDIWEHFRDEANNRYLSYYSPVPFAGVSFTKEDLTIQGGKFKLRGKMVIEFDEGSFEQRNFDEAGYADSQV